MKSSYAATHPVKASIDTAKQIYSHLGWRGFYYGFSAQLVCEAFGRGIYFSMYEVLKALLGLDSSLSGSVHAMTHSTHQREHHPMVYRLLAATGSGMSMWTIMMPFDVIRSNIMVR